MNKKIPTILIHGSLGSGKTTLIKGLLSHAAFAKAFIIENEFASENIDKETLDSHDNNVFDIAGGCICCSSGKELEEALNFLVDKKWDKPVIIETTGVASSAQLVQKLFLNPLFLENFTLTKNVYVLDPLEADPAALQKEKELDIRLADIVLINKNDLADRGRVEAIEALVKKVSPKTLAIRSAHATIDVAILANNPVSRIEEAIAENFSELKNYGIADHGTTYAVHEIDFPFGKSEAEALLAKLRNFESAVLKRAKGYFADSAGNWWHLEATHSHQAINPVGKKKKSVLVFIGPGINGEVIARAFADLKKNV